MSCRSCFSNLVFQILSLISIFPKILNLDTSYSWPQQVPISNLHSFVCSIQWYYVCIFFGFLHVLSSSLFFALWFTWDVYLLEAFYWWVVVPISRGPTSYPSFYVYGLIWWSFSERLTTTSHIPWRAPIGMCFRWWTCINKPCSILSKAN